MNAAPRSARARLAPVLLLLVASLLMAGCGLSGRAVAEPPTPTEPAPAVSPTARPPRPSPTAIPPPSVVGRVTPPPTPPSGVRPRLSLALDGPPWAAQAGLFLARERGFYVEAGLDVFFHVTSSRASALSQLASGRDELGLVGGDDLLRARAEGTPAVSLLALDASPPDGYGLVLATTEPSRERSPEALKSFVLATARGYAEAARDPGAAAETLGRADSEIDRARAERQIGELLPLWRAPGPPLRQDEARWAQAHRRLAELGQVPPTLDPRAAFTNELSFAAEPTATPSPTLVPRPTTPPPPARPTPRPAAPGPARALTATPTAPRALTATPTAANSATPARTPTAAASTATPARTPTAPGAGR